MGDAIETLQLKAKFVQAAVHLRGGHDFDFLELEPLLDL